MRWPEINLAPIKYAKIHKDHGGPIERLSVRKISLFGKPAFEAYAYLDGAVAAKRDNENVIYGNVDGTGTGSSQSQAVYSAISEALERWAWRASLGASNLGLELDSSTTGFAAFPSLGKGPARRRALFEAIERRSVACWWEKRLGHRVLELPTATVAVEGIELEPIFSRGHTVILWKKFGGLVAYGFACSDTPARAIGKASIELERNERVLSLATGEENNVKSQNERRLLFFGAHEGAELFQRRVHTKPSQASEPPKLLIDNPVIGPWSSYAHVWRCLFDGGKNQDTDRNDYFMF